MKRLSSLLLVLALASCETHEVSRIKPTLIRSDYVHGEVAALCVRALETAKTRLDGIAKNASQLGGRGALLRTEHVLAEVQDAVLPLQFMAYVSPDEILREEGSDCETRSTQFFVETVTRKDLYDAIQGAKVKGDAEKRLLAETLKSFESNGLGLPEEKLAQVRELKQRLAGLESQFAANLNNDQSAVELTEEELEGTSEAFRSRLKRAADGRLIVTTKSVDYNQVMQNATRGETRRKMLLAYYNRGGQENVRLMEEAIELRQQIADLMGFETWADYQTSNRMAQNSKNVIEFLSGLRDKLSARNQKDLEKLLEFKRSVEPEAQQVNAWDINYLAYQVKKNEFSLDDEQIRQYFPMEVVMQGMFELYSKLLGVTYVEVKDAKVWAPGVKLYEVREKKSGKLAAYFYADYFPRAGKYGHAAAFSLILGRQHREGYSVPVSSIVANFNPPANGRPSLLNHDEVETIFHEFGHIMHQVLTVAPFASLSGTSVARDFVEAPSQMLENWVWDENILGMISGHYEDTSRKLPAELLEKMLAAKDFNQGYLYMRQLYFGIMDMTFHTARGPVDTTEIVDRLHGELFGIPAIPGGHFQASFGHLMGGYDAGYYGYLWSEVYAQDMFTRFEKEGLLSEKTGRDYRRVILEQGGMKPALDLVREFLGREPNNEAFLRKLGIRE